MIFFQAEGLPGGDLPDPPDPYVKMYLLPARKSKSKRKSEVKKDTVNPVFEETFKAVNILGMTCFLTKKPLKSLVR